MKHPKNPLEEIKFSSQKEGKKKKPCPLSSLQQPAREAPADGAAGAEQTLALG